MTPHRYDHRSRPAPKRKPGAPITTEDLRELMEWSLEVAGQDARFRAGYIAAQEKSGWLRPNCPQWIREAAAVHYAIPHAD